MNDQELPVTVAVTRADGTVEHVRVGTAFKSESGFTLRIGDLAISGTPSRGVGADTGRSSGRTGDGPVFPPYGRSKGLPIRGASAQDLEFYANGARRTLGDPGKARFHEKERSLLAIIEAEQARQDGAGGEEEPPPHGDEDAP
jgi:hypothetical protein